MKRSPDGPPVFLAHAGDDRVVTVDNGFLPYAALRGARIPAKMMLYERSGHGFGLSRPDGSPFPRPMQFIAWARTHGL